MIVKAYPGLILYGDSKYRNKNCPKESLEQITFISWVRKNFPDTHGITLFHAKNEAKLINGQFHAIHKDRAMGMSKGCADIHAPGNPSFCMELKRQDRTLSDISLEQLAYLYAAKEAGAFVCIALGYEAAMNAFNDWLKIIKPPMDNF